MDSNDSRTGPGGTLLRCAECSGQDFKGLVSLHCPIRVQAASSLTGLFRRDTLPVELHSALLKQLLDLTNGIASLVAGESGGGNAVVLRKLFSSVRLLSARMTMLTPARATSWRV